MASFESQARQFYPDYEGIDWRSRFIAWLAEEGSSDTEISSSVRFAEGDLELELSQENTRIVINRIDDAMDCIVVMDPRDAQPWYFFREDFSKEEFASLLSGLALCSMMIATPFPDQEIAKIYLDRQITKQSADLAATEVVPQDWLMDREKDGSNGSNE